MSETLCSFGCERVAMKQLENGRWLCSAFVSQCPAMRMKNGLPKRGRNPFEGRAHPRGMAGKVPWNRGLRWDQMYIADVAQRQRAGASARIGHAHRALQASSNLEAARRAKLSKIARGRGLGGYEPGSGRGRKGWFRGYWCDSTYELVFVVWALDHEIPFERNVDLFLYEYEGKVMRWMPDFLLADGTFVEIKSYLSEQARAKLEYFLPPLRVFTRPDLDRMFDYVHQQYGKDLLALYE